MNLIYPLNETANGDRPAAVFNCYGAKPTLRLMEDAGAKCSRKGTTLTHLLSLVSIDKPAGEQRKGMINETTN